jgi:two-component system CheB/CheR fusion protein
VTTDLLGNILFVHGDISRYLHQPPGLLTSNVADMSREELQMGLRAALLDASAAHCPPLLSREALLKTDRGIIPVIFSIRPLATQRGATSAGEKLLMISFQEVAAPEKHNTGRIDKRLPEAERFEHLERELAYAKKNLEATLEALRTTNEELKSSNEELQATNEELQSSNEEMETSREELESLSEDALVVIAPAR